MPDALWFVPFYEHNPSISDQCIYFTLKGARCRASCEGRDNRRAIDLYRTIIRLPAEDVGIELIEDYIKCVCCRFRNAQHRDRIEDVGLWRPLAVRWLDEIRGQSTGGFPATPPSSYAAARYRTPTSNRTNTTTPPTSVASSSANRNAFPETPTRIAPLSKFRPHIPEPGPADSVSSKIRDILEDRDFETGSLYIFDRDSSPGFVFIGWTASSVRHALESWSECGYTPNLLFSVDRVPHAQRVKTLTQYELINEWRRERKCKAEHCGKSHQGWFEVRMERARKVLGRWAKFMEIAEPYGSGVLKAQWRNFIQRTVNNGETVTAKTLLEHYEQSLSRDTTPVERSVDLEDDLQNVPKLESEGPKGKSVHWDSPLTEQSASTKETEALPEPNSLAGNSRPGPSSGGSLFGPNPLEGNSRPGPSSGNFLFGQSSSAGNPLPGPKSGNIVFGQSSLAGNSLPRPSSGGSLFGPNPLEGNSRPGPKSGNFVFGQSSLAGNSLFGPNSGNNLPGPREQPKNDPIQFKPPPNSLFSFTAEPLFNGSNLNGDSAGQTAARTLPRTNFTSELESPWKTSVPSVSDSLFGTEPLLKLHKDVPAGRAPADEESSPVQTPQPPSPLFQPVDSQDSLSTQLTDPDPGPEIEEEEPSWPDVITKPNTSSAVTESSPLNPSATSPPKPEAKKTSDLPAPLVKETPGWQEKATPPASFWQKVGKVLRNMGRKTS